MISKNKLVCFLTSMAICFVPMFVAWFVMPPGEWYQGLVKPPLTPPGWVFGPVWTILYFMLGIALYKIMRGTAENKKMLLMLFLGQLLLNALWSPLFFGMHGVFISLCLAIAMVVLCAVFLYKAKFHRMLTMLMLPYMLWLCFASYLTAGVLFLN